MKTIDRIKTFFSSKYSLELRRRDYIKVLKYLQESRDQGKYYGLCWCIDQSILHLKSLSNYPELTIQRPYRNEYTWYWFNLDEEGFKKRVAILEKAIKMTS